jgi:hypothetical protein
MHKMIKNCKASMMDLLGSNSRSIIDRAVNVTSSSDWFSFQNQI